MDKNQMTQLIVSGVAAVGVAAITYFTNAKRQSERRTAIVALEGELKQVLDSDAYKSATYTEKLSILEAHNEKLKYI